MLIVLLRLPIAVLLLHTAVSTAVPTHYLARDGGDNGLATSAVAALIPTVGSILPATLSTVVSAVGDAIPSTLLQDPAADLVVVVLAATQGVEPVVVDQVNISTTDGSVLSFSTAKVYIAVTVDTLAIYGISQLQADLQTRNSLHISRGLDSALDSALRDLNVQPIVGVEEVDMFREDGNVLHFSAPKVHAALTANTFAIYGTGHVKELTERTERL
ncbi:hypothetical protein B0H11DRAFT_2201598 [Mycena galericulata]|nr:hypothetical protein B0H11DRAFT_2201598 [Mycena galericulata]